MALNSPSGMALNETERKIVIDVLMRAWNKRPGWSLLAVIRSIMGTSDIPALTDREIADRLIEFYLND